MTTNTEAVTKDERELFEQALRDMKFPVLPVWKDGSPYQNYALEVMWKAWMARAAATSEVAQAPTLKPRLLAQLRRFNECCEDPGAGGHDVDREDMHSLAEMGAVRPAPGGRHYLTDFGQYLLAAPVAPTPETDKRDAEQAEGYSIEGTVSFMRSEGSNHAFCRYVKWDEYDTRHPAHFGNGPDVFVAAHVTDFDRNENRRVRLTVEVLPIAALAATAQSDAEGKS